MTLKKFDLAKNLAKKIESRQKITAIPGRFAYESGVLPDRREQRRLDAVAGLVPFACKLPIDLVDELRRRSAEHPAGMNGLVSEMLQKSMTP